MDVTPLIRQNQHVIQSYANGVFRVSGQSFDTPIIVTPDHTDVWDIGDIADVKDLKVDHFKPLIEQAGEIDVLLLGCGATMAFLPPILRSELKSAGLSVDIMDTGAACRTYNVLMAEGRRVAVALMLT